MPSPRLLVAYDNASTFVATTIEYLHSFRLYSSCEVSYLHVTHGAEIDVDLSEFDVVLNSYCARLCFPGHVSKHYLTALMKFRGLKILAVQDEYDFTERVRGAISDLHFDVVLTCVPQQELESVYPRQRFPETEFVTVLTGYVPGILKTRRRSPVPLGQRPITIGYRGRELPPYYGRLGFEKFEIGRRMREVCAARGIAHDIAMDAESRIYGDAWYEFLGRCRATLGTESGCNVFDFDGSLRERYEETRRERGVGPSYEEFRRYTQPYEDRISMGQVSPRLFEAAAMKTPMVLFSGHYSGVVTPGEHYVELYKDFSNIEIVLDQVNDIKLLTAIAERAYDHLIVSGEYDYRRFVETFDGIIDRKRAEKADAPPVQRFPVSAPAANLWNPVRQEQPTAAPRDVHAFLYRMAHSEREGLRKEVARLHCDYSAEIARLNSALAQAISAQQGSAAEIADLNDALAKTPLARLPGVTEGAARSNDGRLQTARAGWILRGKLWLVANAPRLAMLLRRLKAGLHKVSASRRTIKNTSHTYVDPIPWHVTGDASKAHRQHSQKTQRALAVAVQQSDR